MNKPNNNPAIIAAGMESEPMSSPINYPLALFWWQNSIAIWKKLWPFEQKLDYASSSIEKKIHEPSEKITKSRQNFFLQL